MRRLIPRRVFDSMLDNNGYAPASHGCAARPDRQRAPLSGLVWCQVALGVRERRGQAVSADDERPSVVPRIDLEHHLPISQQRQSEAFLALPELDDAAIGCLWAK